MAESKTIWLPTIDAATDIDHITMRCHVRQIKFRVKLGGVKDNPIQTTEQHPEITAYREAIHKKGRYRAQAYLKGIQAQAINISELDSSQDIIYAHGVKYFLNNPKEINRPQLTRRYGNKYNGFREYAIIGITSDGKKYVIDGNHRISAAHKLDLETVKGKYIHLPAFLKANGFEAYLKEQLKNPKVRKAYEEEMRAGGPGSGRHPGPATHWHGTTLDQALKIAKEGLKPSGGRVYHGYNEIAKNTRHDTGSLVYFANKTGAKFYAEFRTKYDAANPGSLIKHGDLVIRKDKNDAQVKSRPAIIGFHLDSEHPIVNDRDDPERKAKISGLAIGSNKIVSIKVLDNDKWSDVKASIQSAIAKKKAEGPTVHIVVDDKAKQKEQADKKAAKKKALENETPEQKEIRRLSKKLKKAYHKKTIKHIKQELKELGVKAGGPGSGRHKEFGRAKSKFTTPLLSLKQKAALKNYVPTNRKEQNLAHRGEQMVADALSKHGVINHTKDSAAVDVTHTNKSGPHGIEVKSIMQQSDKKADGHVFPRLYMKNSALARKYAWANDAGAKLHTVALDFRNKSTPDVYYRAGVGTSNLGAMTKVSGGLAGLHKYIK